MKTRTNHSGGVNGGHHQRDAGGVRGMHPAHPSIAQPQQTVDLVQRKDAELTITGRHDPCILHRALPVIEAAAALAACQLMDL